MSQSLAARYRSASSTINEQVASDLRALETLVESNTPQSITAALSESDNLKRLRHSLVDQSRSGSARDTFRSLSGFQTLLSVLRLLSSSYGAEELPGEHSTSLLALVKDFFWVLVEALRHNGNRRYFAKRFEDGGWQALEEALKKLVQTFEKDSEDQTQLYSCLFAAATGDETLSDAFSSLSKAWIAKEGDVPASHLLRINQHLEPLLKTTEVLENPEIAYLAVEFWIEDSPQRQNSPFRWAILVAITRIVKSSKRNLIAFHATGILSLILPQLFNAARPSAERDLLLQLADVLAEEGLNNLKDAHWLFDNAASSPEISKFLLSALQRSKVPPSIQFDLSLQGYASVELPTLGRSFPPSSGYTVAFWLKVDSFDAQTHTTLFGVFDASQTCFVLVYLERDTQYLILQTSIKSPRPSVRFKTLKFEAGQWYHVCLVHRKGRGMGSPRASLFVNGEFVEQIKAQYPSPPTLHPSSKEPRVQAFLGTPQDLASRVGKGVSTSRWSLASANLFEEPVSDDLIAVWFNLGPRYHGNFQDCLGSFLSYRSSAALNLRNENLHPGKEEESEIITAIREKASKLFPETRALLSISPATVMDSDDRNNINESQLIRSLSKDAAKNLQHFTRSGGNAIAINGAVPAINDALTQSHGIAILTGEPVVSVPQSLDDASWRIGGCSSVGLHLLDAARTKDSAAMGVEILFETIRDNWRNSEAMEREHGYGILASLIRDKLGFTGTGGSRLSSTIDGDIAQRNDLALLLLRLILGFIGYDLNEPTQSIINNPLAYRILLVDLDVWRFAALPVQRAYYEQFVALGLDSNYHRFNAKRLSRMRITKKLLDALKGEMFSVDVLPSFMKAFKTLVSCSMSAEVLRSLALFVTYAVHHSGGLHRSKSKKVSKSLSVRSSARNTPEPSEGFLSKSQLGVEVLKVFCELLCVEDTAIVKKFARTVTNKWLLYLMSEDDPEVAVLSATILARLLWVHGTAYVKKFADKTCGFTIMRHQLKRWWHVPSLWPVCFSILFGYDVAKLDLDRSFDLFGFLDLFASQAEVNVVCPEILTVIAGMIQAGLKTVNGKASQERRPKTLQPANHLRSRSMSLTKSPSRSAEHSPEYDAATLNTVTRFLADIHAKSQKFRDFAASSSYIQELLVVLYPVVVSSEIVSAELEIDSRESLTLNFNGNDLEQPSPTIIKTSTVTPSISDIPSSSLKKSSSFILVTSDKSPHTPSTARLHHIVLPKSSGLALNISNSVVHGLLEIVIAVFQDQILTRKDFSGLGLFLKVPPGFLEHQAFFESWLLRNTLSSLGNTLMLNQNLLQEPRVLTNLARFVTHIGEAIYEGWFIGGADAMLDFAGVVLEHLQRSDIARLKSTRLCSQPIAIIRNTLFRTMLLRLSEVDANEASSFLEKLTFWQTILLSSEATDDGQSEHLQLVCYLLYARLVSSQPHVRMLSADLWRIVLVQKPGEAASILNHARTKHQRNLSSGFQKIVELDNETFLYWIDEHREQLDAFFFGAMSKTWESFVQEENLHTEQTTSERLSRRKERLQQWHLEEMAKEDAVRRHEVSFGHWASNIYTSEHLKHQRTIQDQNDAVTFILTAFTKLKRELRRPNGLLHDAGPAKWRLDQTEGRNRMRLRIVPDDEERQDDYQPKRRGTETPLKLDTRIRALTVSESVGVTPSAMTQNEPDLPQAPLKGDSAELDDSFEMIDEPNDEDGYEDKNRKVMRSLNRGDQVQHVTNISRIVGLEACEGLLILGKDSLYLLDNFFQRADGEIVNVWQAPQDERDPYVRMIAGRESTEKRANTSSEHETRSWKWEEIISVSKRRFLFRNVGLEVFFTDGRSYLLTLISPQSRNELHSQILSRAPQINGGPSLAQPEDIWRFETLKSPDDGPQTLGSKFANVFNQSSSNPATRKWMKGEISNFHYLMLINTMAGRTFNDLTQYPVFPWILADYTSEELDLTNPKTFRDLSKPMGCQTTEREAEFRDRYQSFAEMGDHNSPPFHYGTHYSSAMIVASYLIRLQPFVQSYLLLQGGSFDHPDRLFYSIANAWDSASRVNMTDVRELTPEFFYLPEFLINSNKYNFGVRQGDQTIDTVALPPWAKGDPKIFIAKHREALESPHVSKNLHRWIDLVFGYKQKGDAAFDAVNVFHHLSYQGAKDLDNIDDPVERLATIGIIHNFGQTPHQVFQRAHPQREAMGHKYKRLDTAVQSLARLPVCLLESHERVASLLFSWKQERLLCSAAFRLNIPPNYDKYMEWGFADGSVRFYSADSRKLIGHFEHLHIGQLSCGIFADSRTLITAGNDCTVSVWTVISSSKSVELQPRFCLFVHRAPVNVLALSRSFSVLLSASEDGHVLLWDLNRRALIRELDKGSPVECARINDVTGNIMVCRENRVSLLTLNGALLLNQKVCDSDDRVISCAFYEGASNEWLEKDLLFTGHKRGVVKIWSKIMRGGVFSLELVRQLDHVDSNREGEVNVASGISYVFPMPQVVYTGDEEGRVYEWDCVQRH